MPVVVDRRSTGSEVNGDVAVAHAEVQEVVLDHVALVTDGDVSGTC